MSGLLDKLETEKSSTSTVPEPVSLESLLLEQAAVEKQESSPDKAEEIADAPAPKSRKARRKKLRSNRVVAKRSSSNDSRREQDRQARLFQERNKKALLKRQKQSDQKNKSGSRNTSLEYVGSISKRPKKNKNRDESIETTSRPVVLATVDFEPTVGKDGRTSPAGSLLKLKRSTRRIKADRQLSPATLDTNFSTPPLVELLGDYSNAKKQFISSLDPSRIEMYKDALGTFGITLEENVSNTETLYTLLKEYALALIHGSSRLDESSLRSLDSSTKLVQKKDNVIEGYYKALTSMSRTSYGQFKLRDSSDVELSAKCLLSIIAKEILFSYNMIKSDDTTFNPKSLLKTKYRSNVLKNPNTRTQNQDAHGVVFSSVTGDPKVKTLNYPFESTGILDNDYKARSSIDFLKDLVNPTGEVFVGNGSFDDPYQASLSSYTEASGKIIEMTSTDDLEFGKSIYVGLLDTILSSLLTTLSDSRYSASKSVQLQILRSAAINSEVATLLMLYLAFRNEKVNKEVATNPDIDGPTKLVKRNTAIKSITDSVGSGKITKTFTVEPQEVELSPGSGDPKVTTFKAPETTQTATLEATPSNFEEGTLESFFGVSFEAVCEALTVSFNNFLRGSSNVKASFGTSEEVTVTVTQVKDALTDIATEDSLFDYLLSYHEVINSALPTSDSDVTDIIVGGSLQRTAYSKIPKRNMFVAFSAAVCKMVYLLLDGKVSSESSKNMARAKTTGKSGKKRGKKASFTKTLQTFSNTKSGTADPVITFTFSPDYLASISDLTAYLNSDEDDTADIADSFPIIAAVSAALEAEETFLRDFSQSLLNYITTVNRKYKDVKESLEAKIGGKSLRALINEGLIPSKDVAKFMKSLTVSLNDQNMEYSGIKFRDNTIGKYGLSYLNKQLKGAAFQKKRKIFVLGIPTGMLEDTLTTPAEISDIRTMDPQEKDTFKIVAQKIDQIRPDQEYEDLEFVFSRSIFAGKVSKTGNSLRFTEVKDDMTTTLHTQNSAVKKFGMDIVTNHRNDFVLKQYSDLQLDLDFNETAFPNDTAAISEILSDKVNVDNFSKINKSNVEFLSASNLAFDPQKRKPSAFDFYDQSANTISLSKQDSDPYAFSLLEYINTYGAIFNPALEASRLEKGVQFDRVLCVLIGDDDFKMKYEIEDADSRSANAEVRSQLTAEKTVHLGSPTSEGLDLNTYRFKIVMGDGED